jgi:hypothetical protein
MEKFRYKFEEITGCTAFDFRVNDKSINELSEEERNDMINYLFLKIKEGLNDQTILLEQVIQLFQYDEYEHDPNMCEQCGDTVSTTIWKI